MPGATAGVATLLTNALPIGAGIVLFHETLPGGVFGVIRIVAFACVVVGAAMLAHPDDDSAGAAGEAQTADAENLPPVRATVSEIPKHELIGSSASVSPTGPDDTA